MTKIVFVGDKPSSKNLDLNIPFVGTKSYKTLLDWIYRMDIDISQVILANTDNFIQRVNIEDTGTKYKYIALGEAAAKYLYSYKLKYYKIGHPSGLNRKLNDKKYVDEMLKKCKDYINEQDT